jgi:hypothetical protein
MSDTAERPTSPPFPTADKVPAELLPKPRFTGWKKVWDESKQKDRKPPHSTVTAEGVGPVEKNAEHFLPFEGAVAGAKRHNLDGIGLVLFKDDSLVFIDIDDGIRDGITDPEVKDWLRWFSSNAWIHESPSGTGYHIIGRGKIPRNLTATPLSKTSPATIEMYGWDHYATLTGELYTSGDSAPVIPPVLGDIQLSIDKLLTHLQVKEPSAPGSAPENARPVSPDRVRHRYLDKVAELRNNPVNSGNGNATLHDTALIAGRVCASGVFPDKTEEQFKKELLDVVTKRWAKPHDENGARATIISGWDKGKTEGPYKLRQYVEAVASAQYCAETPKETPYIVNGMIYHGTANQLMGPIKEGKTTLLFAMIRNILSGSDFIGQKTKPTNILYVTEQPRYSFQSQLARSGLDRNHLLERRAAGLFVLDLGHLWSQNWEGRVETIRENAYKLDAGLVIVDTFPRIALVEEIQNAGEMNQRFELIAPLVVADGRTLLMGWHERKAGGSISEAAAGTAASGGAVDMLLRLRRTAGSKLNDRTRQLELCGRLPVAFEESVAIVLNNDMSNYKCLGTKQAAARRTTEQRILGLLPQESPGLTESEINQRLAAEAEEEGSKPVSVSTVTRALDKLVEGGLVIRTGQGGQGRGKSADPYRYHTAPPAF